MNLPASLGPDFTEQQEYETVKHADRKSQRHNQEPDMKITQMMSSKYFKKDDVEQVPIMLTIKGFEEENVAPSDKPEELKWVMYFDETEKGLVMGPTNLQLGAIAMGSQDTDHWLGKKIVLFNDPTVAYAGKLTGGVRVRAPKNSTPGKSAPKNPDPRPEPPIEDDDIPF